MRYAQAFLPTLKESPADAQVVSHVLMARGGYIRRVAAGVYNFLPLGLRVLQKIQSIIREELTAAGAQEVLMPAAVPAELWQESGRWDKYGPELLRFKDRKGADFCLGPTHEEVIVDMVRRDTSSYRQLPLNLFQIQAKFRDEMRPRAGLMRGREFIMKDAYSFDVDEAGALRQYDAMYAAYERIFRRCGLDFRAVEADTGAIGGSRSHEFQVLAESGEDAIVSCDACDYAANVEQAELATAPQPAIIGATTAITSVPTPGKKTIDEVAAFLKVDPKQTVKALIYMCDGVPVMAVLRGDRTLNEVALKKATGASQLYLARDGEVVAAVGLAPGFIGPARMLKTNAKILIDAELRGASGVVCGGNALDTHFTGVVFERDVPGATYVPLRVAEPGDPCPRCGKGTYRGFRGIEVGHVFYLGTKYSEPMNCTFVDVDRATKPMVMGCYGIGVTRVAAAAVEQNHDAGGIIWPVAIAPFEVEVVALQTNDAEVMAAAQTLYEGLRKLGIDVLLDDRDERPGAKFKDADLIGVPLRVAVGARSLKEGKLELKWRREAEASMIDVAGAAGHIALLVANAKQGRLG